jgi:hypothetical protein
MGSLLNQKINKNTMNIYAVQGDKVRFTASKQGTDNYFGARENAERLLEKEAIYTVKVMHSYEIYTFVELEEFPGLLFYSTDFADL